MSTALKSHLTEVEQSELAQCESVIEKGLLNFVEVGNALLAVSDKRLYRQTHSSFQEYVKEKWNMSARRAYELCEAAEVVNGLVVKGLDCAPMAHTLTNERQARELAKVPEDKREEVLSKAKAGGKLTAKAINEAVKEEAKKPIPQTQDDAWKAAGLSPEVWNPKPEQVIILTALKSNWMRADDNTRAQFEEFKKTLTH